MSSPESSSPTIASTTKNPASGQFFAFVAMGLLLALVVIAYSTIYFGYIEGEEFDAETFTRRSFSYYEIPVVGLQVSPISRTNTTTDLETHLVSQKLVVPSTTATPPTRWDLIKAVRGHTSPNEPRRLISQGDARVLCECLDAEDNARNNVWLEWTKKHSDLAKIVWPAVAKVSRQELYVFAPDMLLRARGANKPDVLQKELHVLLAQKYLAFAQTQQQLGQHEQAVELFTEVLHYSPTTADALVGRAKSLTSLGKGDKASADLAQAQRLGARL